MAIIAVAATSREAEAGPIEGIWPLPAKLHVLTSPVISKPKKMHFVAVACYPRKKSIVQAIPKLFS